MLETLPRLPKAWYVGNTTVRSAYRIKYALRALDAAGLTYLKGNEHENRFARVLDAAGVVSMSRLDDNPDADVSDMGRKWRVCLTQLGFITPDHDLLRNNHVNMPAYMITANGRRLIETTSLSAEQECFLRVLLAQQIPSPVEEFVEAPPFNPLRVVLAVLLELERRGLEIRIAKNEMASIVQLLGSEEHAATAADIISRYRAQEAALQGRDRQVFQNQVRKEAANASQNDSTLNDYADTNFRYLKLTGLFVDSGRGIVIADHRWNLVRQIMATPFQFLTGQPYLLRFWDGAGLPTDNLTGAAATVLELAELLRREFDTEQPVPTNLNELPVQEVNQIRHNLEQRIFELREIQYAENQAQQWEEIYQYMQALQQPRTRGGPIPQGEAPAYFEWVLWRAFLAIDSLVNMPWEARRFDIDVDFRPRFTAPGGGPDMVFEFDDFVIIAEVTLTASSRQEAAEGEPVRRHVAQYVDRYPDKEVYGLFVANTIDTNTAETFRIGVWYRNDDSPLALRIVPFTLEQFAALFAQAFRSQGGLNSGHLYDLLLRCRAESNATAPVWKQAITRHVQRAIQQVTAN